MSSYKGLTLGSGSKRKKLNLRNGDSAANVTINRGGDLCIYDGKATKVTLNLGGHLNVETGGRASNVTVNKGGNLSIQDGTLSSLAKVTNVTVRPYAEMHIFWNGAASNVTIEREASLSVMDVNSVSNITFRKGSILEVERHNDYYDDEPSPLADPTIPKGWWTAGFIFNSDAKLANLTKISNVAFSGVGFLQEKFLRSVSNVSICRTDFYLFRGETHLYVYKGGTVTNATISKRGKLDVRSGGTASKVTVNRTGVLEVRGGKVANIAINAGGKLYVNGGKVANVTFSKGAKYGNFTFTADAKCVDLKKIFNAKVSGKCKVGSAAGCTAVTVSNITLSGKGANLSVCSGGTASKATVGSGTTLQVQKGGKAKSVTVMKGGKLGLETGGAAASGITVDKGAQLVMRGGSKATNITVKKGGSINGIAFKSDTKYANSNDFFNKKLADTTDDTWNAVSKKTALLTGKDISGWVGLKDAKDFVKIQIQKGGKLSLKLDDDAKQARRAGKLDFTLLDSSGNAIGLAAAKDGFDLTSSAVLNEGSICYLGINCTDKNYYTGYKVRTGVLASA